MDELQKQTAFAAGTYEEARREADAAERSANANARTSDYASRMYWDNVTRR